MALITLDHARSILKYEPETGYFFWKPRPIEMFLATAHHTQWWNFSRWNTNYAEQRTFTLPHTEGYVRGKINGRYYLAHRMAWFLTYGVWPENDIDHFNGVRNDNRLKNLFAKTRSENMQNTKQSSNNKSGITGVWWNKGMKRWCAEITINYEKITLGYYHDIEDAAEIRKIAAGLLGFTERHGTK